MKPADKAAAAALVVESLSVSYRTTSGSLDAVRDVTFTLRPGEKLSLVGEDGSGKTSLALALMRGLPSSATFTGNVVLGGTDLTTLPERQMRSIRGARMAMITADPMTSLNPVLTVGEQIAEVIRAHERVSRREAKNRAVDCLARVGIPSPEKQARNHPGSFSGGMRQRVATAMALACNPGVIIADEATTALDVTIQAQVIELMAELCEEIHSSLLFITNNLAVAIEVGDRTAVMYAGEIVELASSRQLSQRPRHPYSVGLFGAAPDMNVGRERLTMMPLVDPSLGRGVPGCSFHPRCPSVMAKCRGETPEMYATGKESQTKCFLYLTDEESN